jgi:hypothetical protein
VFAVMRTPVLYWTAIEPSGSGFSSANFAAPSGVKRTFVKRHLPEM